MSPLSLVFIFAAVASLEGQVESKELIKLSAFNSCSTDEFIIAQNACSVVQNQRSLPNWQMVLVDGTAQNNDDADRGSGFLSIATESPCLTASPLCQSDQFTYFGWVKFHEYPKCGKVAAYLTSPKFDIHLLASGHLKVTIRTKWFKKVAVMVSRLPVLVDEWYVLFLQVDLSTGHFNSTVKLILNKKDYSGSVEYELDLIRLRNNRKDSNLVLFGTDESKNDGFTKVELSRAYFADYLVDFDEAWNNLTREKFLREACNFGFRFLNTGPFTCYDFPNPTFVRAFADHQEACSGFGHYFGYYTGKPIKVTDLNVWHKFLVPKIKRIARRYNYTFWTSPDQGSLYNENDAFRDVLDEEQHANDTVDANNCTVLDTTVEPWTFRKVSCDEKHAVVCEMSWDCLANNPCQNDGLCRQTEDGAVCECLEGTSGKFCEHGISNGQLTEAPDCNNI